MRDEMANMAWGVERVIESATESALNMFDQRRVTPPPPHEQTQEKLIYKLATEVPDYWVPLLPVQTSAGLRLKRGKVLKADGSREFVRDGRILNPMRRFRMVGDLLRRVPREVFAPRAAINSRAAGVPSILDGRRKRSPGRGSSGEIDTLALVLLTFGSTLDGGPFLNAFAQGGS